MPGTRDGSRQEGDSLGPHWRSVEKLVAKFAFAFSDPHPIIAKPVALGNVGNVALGGLFGMTVLAKHHAIIERRFTAEFGR